MKTVFEANGLRYVKCGDYFIPDLGLTNQEQEPLSKYGIMRKKVSGREPPRLVHKNDPFREAV